VSGGEPIELLAPRGPRACAAYGSVRRWLPVGAAARLGPGLALLATQTPRLCSDGVRYLPALRFSPRAPAREVTHHLSGGMWIDACAWAGVMLCPLAVARTAEAPRGPGQDIQHRPVTAVRIEIVAVLPGIRLVAPETETYTHGEAD
jgi:hypothetical protein